MIWRASSLPSCARALAPRQPRRRRWRFGCQRCRRSSHKMEQAIPAYRPRPVPERPGRLALGDREENELGATDEIPERYVADSGHHAAVLRIVAVVAHHEVMTGRHDIFDGVVVEAVVLAIERLVADAIGQRLLPALHPRGRLFAAARTFADVIAEPLALDRRVVDIEQPVLHLDAVARQADQALDVVCR